MVSFYGRVHFHWSAGPSVNRHRQRMTSFGGSLSPGNMAVLFEDASGCAAQAPRSSCLDLYQSSGRLTEEATEVDYHNRVEIAMDADER